MDFFWTAVIIFIASIIATLTTWVLTDKLFYGLLCGLILLGTLTVFRQVVKFSINLTRNTLTIKKAIFGIPYLTITKHFDNVYYNDRIHFLSFQNQKNRIDIENHEGFEVDCLLVTVDNENYEFGNKQDAQIIFNYILDGLNKLKISKTISDIGLAK